MATPAAPPPAPTAAPTGTVAAPVPLVRKIAYGAFIGVIVLVALVQWLAEPKKNSGEPPFLKVESGEPPDLPMGQAFVGVPGDSPVICIHKASGARRIDWHLVDDQGRQIYNDKIHTYGDCGAKESMTHGKWEWDSFSVDLSEWKQDSVLWVDSVP